MRNASWRTVFTSFLFQAGFASFEFCLEKYGNLILADGILWRLNYFTSVRSRLTSAYNNNNNYNNAFRKDLVLLRGGHCPSLRNS